MSFKKTDRKKKGIQGSLLIGSIVVWALLIVGGFFLLAEEEFTPVSASAQASSFPQNSSIPLAKDKPTLVLFVHPYCPCSRASLHELDEMLASTSSKISTVVVFTIPDGIEAGWEQGELWKTASAMTSVRVMRDDGGREAKLFGVIGSGHTLLYDKSGQLLFSGGITSSRGHEGDSIGRSAVENLVLNGHSLIHQTPVYGCSLL
jgi:hypothetical protein